MPVAQRPAPSGTRMQPSTVHVPHGTEGAALVDESEALRNTAVLVARSGDIQNDWIADARQSDAVANHRRSE
jgi:hypothetical protein